MAACFIVWWRHESVCSVSVLVGPLVINCPSVHYAYLRSRIIVFQKTCTLVWIEVFGCSEISLLARTFILVSRLKRVLFAWIIYQFRNVWEQIYFLIRFRKLDYIMYTISKKISTLQNIYLFVPCTYLKSFHIPKNKVSLFSENILLFSCSTENIFSFRKHLYLLFLTENIWTASQPHSSISMAVWHAHCKKVASLAYFNRPGGAPILNAPPPLGLKG